jgi:HEPN domain-containing protein
MRHALSDLALARIEAPESVLTEALCFHAQQATEKALKALLVAHGKGVPRTHNIETLLERLAAHRRVPASFQEAARLSVYAVLTRYPADLEPVTQAEHREAVEMATTVVRWVQQELAAGG